MLKNLKGKLSKENINILSLIALLLIVSFFIIAILAPLISPFDPSEQDLASRLKPPFWSDSTGKTYILGTDQLGRDLLSRVLYGARVSVAVGLLAALIAGTLGSIIGLISGYYKSLDNILMRIADIQMGFPTILLALIIVAVLGGGLLNIILILGITGWVEYARVVRSEVMKIKETELVSAVLTIGSSDFRILTRHIFPNILSPVITIATFQVAAAIITESSLSFLGLGIPPEIPSWGNILNEGQLYIEHGWWISIFPGICIMLIVLSINILGDSLRDKFDPKSKK